ncbi:MAG: hypothetical protein ACREIT_03700 [Tepidisphaeraceae bacterium]
MSPVPDIFGHQIDFAPGGDFEAFLRQVPAKWVVYLFADEHDQPIQLLCVKNLRYSLKRRLGGEEMLGTTADAPTTAPSRRVDYRQIVRRVHWRRVDSAFEADAVYLEAARAVFPKTYQGMVGFRPAWFVHVNPDAEFPRYLKTTDLARHAGIYIGPLEDKHAAGKLIELVEDAFDLCRYYNVLVEAPRGKACAYKEMGKCPAPCDGSVSMAQYRRLVELSAATLVDPADFLRGQTRRMQQAAVELRFETAAKIKAYIEQLSQLGKGPFRYVRRLQDFQFLSLQRGSHLGFAKAFLVTPGNVDPIADLLEQPARPGELLRTVLTLATERVRLPLDGVGAERVGVVSHHLFSAKKSHGMFIPLDAIDEKAIVSGYREVQKQQAATPAEGESENEGVMKELQAMG